MNTTQHDFLPTLITIDHLTYLKNKSHLCLTKIWHKPNSRKRLDQPLFLGCHGVVTTSAMDACLNGVYYWNTRAIGSHMLPTQYRRTICYPHREAVARADIWVVTEYDDELMTLVFHRHSSVCFLFLVDQFLQFIFHILGPHGWVVIFCLSLMVMICAFIIP